MEVKSRESQTVTMSVENYLERFADPPSASLVAIQRTAQRRGLNKLPLREINTVVKRIRQARPSRAPHRKS